MRFTVCEDFEGMSRAAAGILAEAVSQNPALLLCAASGGSPTRTYELFAVDKQLGDQLRVLKLDEWAGLAMDDPASCEAYLQRYLIGPLGLPPERYISFDGAAADLPAECAALQQRINDAGPIDLCVLGVGLNGHLALNEPADTIKAGCHVAVLAESSKTHPMLDGRGTPLSHGLTLGMADILRSRQILVLVSGEQKREVMEKLLSRKVTPQFPASFLWLHKNVVFLCDEAAMAGLEAPS